MLGTLALAPINRIVSRNVAARMNGRTQVELAAYMKRTEAWASGFLNEKNAVPVSALVGLAAFADCTIPDLFGPIPQADGVSRPVTGVRTDATHGAPDNQADLLRRLEDAERANATIRKAVAKVAKGLLDIAAVGKEA